MIQDIKMEFKKYFTKRYIAGGILATLAGTLNIPCVHNYTVDKLRNYFYNEPIFEPIEKPQDAVVGKLIINKSDIPLDIPIKRLDTEEFQNKISTKPTLEEKIK